MRVSSLSMWPFAFAFAFAPALAVATLAACGGAAPATAAGPSTIPVVAVDAGAGLSVADPPPRASGFVRKEAEDLKVVMNASIGMIEAYLDRCRAVSPEHDGLRSMQASLYADRDEVTIRLRRVDFGDRDLGEWARRHRRLHAELEKLADRACPGGR